MEVLIGFGMGVELISKRHKTNLNAAYAQPELTQGKSLPPGNVDS
jgi:hypothetical protein